MRRQYRLYAEHDYARLKKQATSYKLVKVGQPNLLLLLLLLYTFK